MKQYILLFSVLLAVIVSSFVIHLPYHISCSGKILPAREWIVKSENGGDIISIFNTYQNNSVYNFVGYKFDRGDIANFVFSKKLADDYSVNKHDTIGYISSYLFDEKLTQLENSLLEEKAYLLALVSGEKASLVESAKNKYALARQDFDLQARNYERYKSLHDKRLIADAEFEEIEKSYEAAQTNVALSKNDLLTVETGDKPELINYENAKISSIENEIKILGEKQRKYLLVAPFAGKVVTKKLPLNDPSVNAYNILHLIDTAEYVVLLPVELFQRKYITKDIRIETLLSGNNQLVEGKYIGENQDVELTGNYKQVCVIKGGLKTNGINIPYGIYAQCTIDCGEVSLFEYIKRKIRV